MKTTALVILISLSLGCGAARRAAHGPTLANDLATLESDLDLLPPFPEPASGSGSLWSDGGPGAALFRDTRAFRVNDLIRVRVLESALGSNESATGLSRSSEVDIPGFRAFGKEFSLPIVSAGTDTSFDGDGKTSRASRVQGFVTARVMRVLPNGDLVLGGQKSVTVNRERQILTLVGSVRPVDVGPTNEVPSTSIADLNLRLWGKGEVDGATREGWFLRMLHRLWPF